MGKITKLTAGKSREKRVNVFLDGKFAISLPAEIVLKEGLQAGQELSASQIEALARSGGYHRCLNAAFRYLSYRPRSESEVRTRLQQHGFDGDCTEKVLAKLKEQGLVDDTAFAYFWKENRQSLSPRSQRLTKLELQRKGLASDVIEQVIADVDDNDAAYQAALSRTRRYSPADYQSFRRRLGEYLRRRGFGYEVINHTLEKVWKEYGGSPDSVTG